MHVRRQIAIGAVFIAIGLTFLAFSSNYAMGTASRMGPGWFPAAVALLLAIVGVATIAMEVLGRRSSRVAISRRDTRAVGWVCASLLSFGALLPRLGLVPATVALTVLAMAGQSGRPRLEYVVVPVALAALVTVLFGWLLKLPVPLLPDVR